MGTSSLYGNIARHSTVLPILNDKSHSALQVDGDGALLTAVTLPIGNGSFVKNRKYADPARYNSNLLTLEEGDYCALQTDQNGKVLLSTPPPESITLILDDEGSTIIVGDIINFHCEASITPDEDFVIHIEVVDGATDDFGMATVGAEGSYAWQTYYSPPFFDVGDIANVWIIGRFNGIEHLSNVIMFEGV